jgi:ribosomal-protein-alanine acetyltransferase
MSAHCQASASSEATIDRFRLRDLAAVRRLEKDSFGPHAFDAAMFFYFALSRSHRFLVARDQGEMAGYVVGQQAGWGRRSHGHIVSIAVQKSHRGRGLGALLLNEMLAQLRDAGVDEVVLEVGEANQTAIRLYRRLGFEVDRTLPDFYGPGQHALRMVLAAHHDPPAGAAE